jgi:hypothetical protein
MFPSLVGSLLQEFVAAVVEDTYYILDDKANDDISVPESETDGPSSTFDDDGDCYSAWGTTSYLVETPNTAAEEACQGMHGYQPYFDPLHQVDEGVVNDDSSENETKKGDSSTASQGCVDYPSFVADTYLEDKCYSSFVGASKYPANEPATAADEVVRRMDDVQTYVEPLLYRDIEVYVVPLHLANDENFDNREKIVVREDVYLEGSIAKNEMQDFLMYFDIADKTEVILRVLQDHEDTVGVHFQNHVPMHVTYAEFWERFFYRCDEQRVQREWDRTDKSTTDNLGGLSRNMYGLIQDTKSDMLPASPTSVIRSRVQWNLPFVSEFKDN